MYEIRARDAKGDFGIRYGRYFWRWRARQHLAKAMTELVRQRKMHGWVTNWEFYIKETPWHR